MKGRRGGGFVGTYCADKLDLDARVLQPLAILWSYCDRPFY